MLVPLVGRGHDRSIESSCPDHMSIFPHFFDMCCGHVDQIDLLEQALLQILFGGAYGVLEIGEVDQDVVQHLSGVHTVATSFDVAADQVHDVLNELFVFGVLSILWGQR